ncbi:hypothetical protein, partial [Cronobacter sakazakii]|uniref:hypothetical protein n=1 Tax=Cronobacter sakazakii TaxID=28141 RepID=UPI001BCBEB02|nr:hypothetical protein [Cronobacter sakazakii]
TSFDTVVLAAPYQFANIEFTPALASVPWEVDYVALHVTIFTSPHLLSPAFVGRDGHGQVPSTILITITCQTRSTGQIESNSYFLISTLRTLSAETYSDVPQHLYKIFSHEPVKASLLADLYGFDFYPQAKDDGIDALKGTEHVTWYHHKLWNSYPYEVPRTQFQ